jgi:hypothetical protein
MNPATLDLSTVSLSEVSPAGFNEEDVPIRFSSVQSMDRDMVLTFTAEVIGGGPKIFKDKESGAETVTMLVEPMTADLGGLVDLQHLFGSENGAELAESIDFDVAAYTFRPTVTPKNQIRLKLKTTDTGEWSFVCDSGLTPTSKIAPGTLVYVTVKPGFYWSSRDKMYGMYLTVKQLELLKKKVNRKK